METIDEAGGNGETGGAGGVGVVGEVLLHALKPRANVSTAALIGTTITLRVHRVHPVYGSIVHISVAPIVIRQKPKLSGRRKSG